jgi:hypothetical protein
MIHRPVVHGTIFYLFPSRSLYHIAEEHEHRWKRKLKVTVQAKTETEGEERMPQQWSVIIIIYNAANVFLVR